jgi:hypothetical protein
MRTFDSLPDRVTPAQTAERNRQYWDQRHAFRDEFAEAPPAPAPTVSKSGNAAGPVPETPGGKKFSHAELADYSNRPDRNYAGANTVKQPGIPVNSLLEATAPLRKVASSSFQQGGAARPTESEEFRAAKERG